jgi:hypothetical protein
MGLLKAHAPPVLYLLMLPFYLFAWAIGTFNYNSLKKSPSFIRNSSAPDDMECRPYRDLPLGEEYRANDGIVPLFSQWHPRSCRYVAYGRVALTSFNLLRLNVALRTASTKSHTTGPNVAPTRSVHPWYIPEFFHAACYKPRDCGMCILYRIPTISPSSLCGLALRSKLPFGRI